VPVAASASDESRRAAAGDEAARIGPTPPLANGADDTPPSAGLAKAHPDCPDSLSSLPFAPALTVPSGEHKSPPRGHGKVPQPISLREGRHISMAMLAKMPPVDIWQKPETDAVIRGMAMALHSHLADSATGKDATFLPHKYDRFSERVHPLERGARPDAAFPLPSMAQVHEFVAQLHRQLDIEVTILIMTFIYVERVLVLNAWPLLPHTWRRMVVAAMLEAAKLLFDELVWNVDLTEAFPAWDLGDINELESFFCESLQFNFHVRSSTYAKYYFAITSLPHSARRRTRRQSGHDDAVHDAIKNGVGARVEERTLDSRLDTAGVHYHGSGTYGTSLRAAPGPAPAHRHQPPATGSRRRSDALVSSSMCGAPPLPNRLSSFP